MIKTKNFDISVPELGDKPNIIQVSEAIQNLEDALAGTIEMMSYSISGNKIALTSHTRTTKRTAYYNGLSVAIVAKATIPSGSITTISVDGLSNQNVAMNFVVNSGDMVILTYQSGSFTGKTLANPKSSAVDSTSEVTVATSLAVKKAYDKANQASASCPYRVGDILTTTLSEHPALTWTGTTWQKIEDKFLYAGTIADRTGGSKKILEAQLPSHRHTATQASHYHTQVAHRHLLFANAKTGSVGQTSNITSTSQVSATAFSSNVDESYSLSSSSTDATLGRSNAGGGDNTGSATPTITVGYTGGGEDYMPVYYEINVWKRLS